MDSDRAWKAEDLAHAVARPVIGMAVKIGGNRNTKAGEADASPALVFSCPTDLNTCTPGRTGRFLERRELRVARLVCSCT